MIAGSMILPRIPGRRWLLFRMELMGLISMVNGIMRFLSALVSMGIWVQVTTIIIKGFLEVRPVGGR